MLYHIPLDINESMFYFDNTITIHCIWIDISIMIIHLDCIVNIITIIHIHQVLMNNT